MWLSLRKLKIIPGFHSYITEINSRHRSRFLFSVEVEDMLLLTIFNRAKTFRWYFLMFANNWIYWKVELLQHVNLKCNNKFWWQVIDYSTGTSLYYISTNLFSTTYKHYYKIISQGNGKFVDIHHVWNAISNVSCIKLIYFNQ